MERVNYSELIQRLLSEHLANDLSDGNTEVQSIFDCDRDRYMILHLGWEGSHRVFGCVVYVEIKKDKIWIERDRTEMGIASKLVAAGIPKSQIVLGFHSPQKRPYTEFATH